MAYKVKHGKKQTVYIAQTYKGWVVKRIGKGARTIESKNTRTLTSAKKEFTRMKKKVC